MQPSLALEYLNVDVGFYIYTYVGLSALLVSTYRANARAFIAWNE